MTDASDVKRDFFVSFNKADRTWATWIAWVLEAAGYSVFFQDWDFKGNFVLEMDRAHTQSRRTIAVLSPDYLASRFTAPEWAARFAQDAASQHDPLIPVRVRPCELEGLLAQIVYVDIVGCEEEAAKKRLLDRVSGIRTKPDEPPLYPSSTAEHRAVPKRPGYPGMVRAAGRWLNKVLMGGGIAAITAVLSWAVTQLLLEFHSGIEARDPLAISVEDNPARIGAFEDLPIYGMIPGDVRTTGSPGPGCGEFHTWLKSNGGDVGPEFRTGR